MKALIGVGNGGLEGACPATASYVETDSVYGDSRRSRSGTDALYMVPGAAELGRKGHGARRIIDGDSDKGAEALEFLHFLYGINDRYRRSEVNSRLEISFGLAGIRIDDAIGHGAAGQVLHLEQLLLRCAVEVDPFVV